MLIMFNYALNVLQICAFHICVFMKGLFALWKIALRNNIIIQIVNLFCNTSFFLVKACIILQWHHR